MMRLKDCIQIQTGVGEPVIAGDIMVTPQFQTLTVRLPIGGSVWNRPTALLVEQGGRATRLPIRDITTVKPVLDMTKIILAGLTAWIVMLTAFGKIRKASKG